MKKEIVSINSSKVYEVEIKKSTFIGLSYVVNSAEEVTKILSKVSEENPSATHICYAYKIGENEQKFDDNGEPQGTAGKPILDCITKKNLCNILVVVVRYFGGIKLGAGGLVRAYSSTASNVIALSEIKTLELYKKIKFNLSISENKFVKKIENDFNFHNTKTIYHDLDIVIETNVHYDFLLNLQQYVNNLLNRNVEIILQEDLYL